MTPTIKNMDKPPDGMFDRYGDTAYTQGFIYGADLHVKMPNGNNEKAINLEKWLVVHIPADAMVEIRDVKIEHFRFQTMPKGTR